MAALKVGVPNFSKSAIEWLLLYGVIRDPLWIGEVMVIELLNSDHVLMSHLDHSCCQLLVLADKKITCSSARKMRFVHV